MKKCKTCKYRGKVTDGVIGCDYIVITGDPRGCRVECCTRYEKGNKVQRDVDIVISKKAPAETSPASENIDKKADLNISYLDAFVKRNRKIGGKKIC